MKNLLLLSALFLGSLMYQTSFAQVSVRVNIGSQPIWGPVGYDYVDYYYLPEIETYYYVQRHKYVYMENGRWISKSYLPERHRNYDMYRGRKIVINEDRPYMHHNDFRDRYASPKENEYHQSIRDSRDERYFENKNHPEHSKWKAAKKNNKRKDK